MAIVEKESLGGICLNWGCIPTKALLKSAQVYEYAKHAADYGINIENPSTNFDGVIKRSRGVADKMSKGVQFLMKKNKIDVIMGNGKLIAAGKLDKAITDGAKVLSVAGNFEQALDIVREIVEKYPVQLVNSINPFRLEGQKTGAFEIVDALGEAPDYLAIPVGNAGNITAYWKGFNEYRDAGRNNSLPRMIGFQSAGAAPLVLGHPVENPETIATAIRIGNPARGDQALTAAKNSDGLIDAVTDKEILDAYRLVASVEGTFCEPASAASIAGVIKKKGEGMMPEGATVVCVLTGHGLKDPDTAISTGPQVTKVAADFDQVVKILNL
mgnify:CR=1 FL=1